MTLLSGLVIFLLAFFRAKRLMLPDAFFGISTFLLFLIIGITTTSLHLPQNQPGHYIHHISSEEVPIIKLQIETPLKPDLYNHKFVAEVLSVNGLPSHGKLLLLQPKDSLKTPFLEGEELLVSTTPKVIPPPLNPHQFDYSRFMAQKGNYRQLDLNSGIVKELPATAEGLRIKAAKFRKRIVSALSASNFGSEELAVVQALLLGQKQDISAETYNNFSAAGAIHILAVSGLHVGIILLLLNWIFAPLRRSKNGKIIKTFLVVMSLWGFAILAGLSPSVVRAVTMFSFIAIGLEINRRTSTLNSVFLSLLLLLLIQPRWIFEIGFQLSYLAVISIILFQPLFSRLLEPKTKIGKYFWSLLTVTMAAQIGVVPLSLFYFHQFPGLFFLTNLLILPFLGLILIFGVAVIILALLGFLPHFILKTYEGIIELLNEIVALIARQEQFLLKDIPFSTSEVFAWYFLIFMVFLLWRKYNYQKLLLTFCAVVIIQSLYLAEKVFPDEHLVIFHKSRATLIARTEGKKLQLYQQDLKDPVADLKLIKNYRTGAGLDEIAAAPLKNIYAQKGHFLILVDSSAILPKQIPSGFNLLLSGSPKINLERILEQAKPAAIVADGNNYKSFVNRWRETAREKDIPFHFTGEQGAYLLE
ncbi:ComEC/Rec2 family competence protein [Salinimicrobium oceani]|uniref:ComEC family competence protein n=1 Tax=Salinimicrobium oceani TaxID=2722702 RepID=A0ABX1CXY2_9FLAO|nr:ComEC family competence protein [Salinimicrobium oceani]